MTCTVLGCDKRMQARGWCNAHYMQWRRASRGPEFDTYVNMVQRCTNPNHPRYHRYGGRGITIDPRWLGEEGYATFLADMGPRPADPADWSSTKAYWSVDRIDNDGPYGPDNCRWASPSEQAHNRQPAYQLLQQAA